MHKLKKMRAHWGLSVQELSELSEISTSAIYRIERGSPHDVHLGVAMALSDALDCELRDLFDTIELTHKGRPPHTGVPIGTADVIANSDICPSCQLAKPTGSKTCDNCD